MANTLRVKRNAWNATGSNAAPPSSGALTYGELAWENTTGTLYIGKQTDASTILSKRVIPNATDTILGAAAFSDINFVVNSGIVQIKDLGISSEELKDDAVTSAKLNSNLFLKTTLDLNSDYEYSVVNHASGFEAIATPKNDTNVTKYCLTESNDLNSASNCP